MLYTRGVPHEDLLRSVIFCSLWNNLYQQFHWAPSVLILVFIGTPSLFFNRDQRLIDYSTFQDCMDLVFKSGGLSLTFVHQRFRLLAFVSRYGCQVL